MFDPHDQTHAMDTAFSGIVTVFQVHMDVVGIALVFSHPVELVAVIRVAVRSR
jgi:hypothetical protein